MTNAGKIGCAASFAVFALAIVIMGLLDVTEPEWTGERWLAGKSYSRDFTLDHKSLGGHFEIDSVTANFDGAEVSIVSTRSNPWGHSIERGARLTWKGIPLSTGRKKISAGFQVVIPEKSDLVGRKGDLVIHGVVKYPFVDLADAIAPDEKPTFTELEVEFEECITDIKIVADKKEEKDGPGWIEGLIGFMIIASFIGGLMSLGNREE